MLTYDDNQKATKAHCRLAFSAQPQRFFLPLLVRLHGSTDTTARKSAIIEEKMFWKVTLPSTLIFSAKMFARLTLQFLFTYICICNCVRSVSFSNGGFLFDGLNVLFKLFVCRYVGPYKVFKWLRTSVPFQMFSQRFNGFFCFLYLCCCCGWSFARFPF